MRVGEVRGRRACASFAMLFYMISVPATRVSTKGTTLSTIEHAHRPSGVRSYVGRNVVYVHRNARCVRTNAMTSSLEPDSDAPESNLDVPESDFGWSGVRFGWSEVRFASQGVENTFWGVAQHVPGSPNRTRHCPLLGTPGRNSRRSYAMLRAGECKSAYPRT
jgi:hypothetical protein